VILSTTGYFFYCYKYSFWIFSFRRSTDCRTILVKGRGKTLTRHTFRSTTPSWYSIIHRLLTLNVMTDTGTYIAHYIASGNNGCVSIIHVSRMNNGESVFNNRTEELLLQRRRLFCSLIEEDEEVLLSPPQLYY
jgi:hypothetical protein